jgi:peroxiredoxin
VGERSRWVVTPLLPVALLLFVAVPGFAIEPGDAAPGFELPWLDESGSARATDLFADHPLTVLMVWDRGCPHCTEVALASSALADSVEPLGVQVVGVVMGPDDPDVLRDLFWDERLGVRHLWDGERRLAGAYGLGFQHLGIFLVDRAGTVRATFDDSVPDPVTPIVPAVREALTTPSDAVPMRSGVAMATGLPVLHLDGRIRLLTTDGARPGDTGLFGEHLENGSLALFRWEISGSWSLAPGVEFEPLLRISNESDEVLTQGSERISSRYGSASLRARRGPVAATIGAYRARISPLLMQRWDERDAPPIGGITGCGVCGAGASALQQRSLEVLRPEYLFEGISAGFTHRYGRVQGWTAVPVWENRIPANAPFSEWEKARYRQVVSAGAVDLGRTMRVDPDDGLPQPVGLRIGVVSVDDDQRTLPSDEGLFRPIPRDEFGVVALGRLGPIETSLDGIRIGAGIDGEIVEWQVDDGARVTKAEGYRYGISGECDAAPFQFWGRGHRLKTERDFDPLFRALTYDKNRKGWRFAAGARLHMPSRGHREVLGASVFFRQMEETEAQEAPMLGTTEFDVLSLSLVGRPIPELAAELGLIRARTLTPIPDRDDPETRGVTLDIHWEGWPALDPGLHVEVFRTDPTGEDPTTIWQSFISVRVRR